MNTRPAQDKSISFKELVKVAEEDLFEDISCDLLEYLNLENKRIKTQEKHVISWRDLELNATKLPEYRETSILVIEGYLGFIPSIKTLSVYELYFRTLIYQKDMRLMSDDSYFDDLIDHLKRIRNHEFRLAPWFTTEPMTELQREVYQTENILFADRARELVKSVIGYEPEVLHSFCGEIILRGLLAMEDLKETDKVFQHWVHLAGWMSVYRKAMFEEGIEAADKLPISAVRKLWDGEDDNLD